MKAQMRLNARKQSGRTHLGNAEISPGEATSHSGVIILKNLETNAAMKADGYPNTIPFIAFWSSAKCSPDCISNPGFFEMPCLPYAQFSLPQ